MFNLIVTSVLILLWYAYKKLTADFQIFEEQGIGHEKPVLIFGNMFSVTMAKTGLFHLFDRLYEKYYNEKVFGLFSFTTPWFVVKDAEIIKQITIKDFDSFINHDKGFDESIDKIAGIGLFSLHDEKWRTMRNNLSPFFTSSKMKMMFEMVSECAQDFVSQFEKNSLKGEANIVENDHFARYTVDGICTAALGFKGDCIANKDSQIMKIATSISFENFDFITNLKFILNSLSRSLYMLLGLQFLHQDVRDFLHRVIIDVMHEREKKGIFRPDIVQHLLQVKNGKNDDREKTVEDKDLSNFSANVEYDVKPKERKINWTKEDFMAQGFLFFVAGFETTKNLLQTCCYELAMNPDVQQELIDEVDEVISSMNGKEVSYEALHKMKFLDRVISETLRMWPPAPITNRECNKDYRIDLGNGKTLQFKNGDQIQIPIRALQLDPKYFENPTKFDPNRFNDERKHSIVAGSYIPFGSGPRVCVGSRFALMEAKLLMFKILSKFTIEKCEKTPKNLEFAHNLGLFELKENIYVELKPRTEK